ncbi:ANK [Seminavis robusta]|uniref:ANK n=1 Tax=Seminavis robusta TaxID=568900 RepID=A0A9N8ED54_9STRA|nr:ANK [Seminavis robusta]|eukprot:Sro1003_g229980.1 ANK (216) ;mRNA; f:9705-10352
MTSVVSNQSASCSPLNFLANLAGEQQRSLALKKTITNADLAVSPSLYLKALFMKSCPHIMLPLRSNLGDMRAPPDIYDMELSRAVRMCDLDKMRELHNAGKSFDACNRFGESLLHMACRRGDARVVKFLIEEAKVQVDVTDDFGRTVLHDACWTGSVHTDVMDVLITAVPPEFWVTEDKRGHTPFDYAPRKDWGPWLRYLRSKQGQFVRNFAYLY